MKRFLFCISLAATAQQLRPIDSSLGDTFRFEETDQRRLWPRATIDEEVAHEGKRSARIRRVGGDTNPFTSIAQGVTFDVSGNEIEFRGYLKTQDVTGFAALWIRQDGTGQSVAFRSMPQQPKDGEILKGTTDWKQYSLKFPVSPKARSLYFGALLSGEGTVWIDDLELLVDGKPIWEAPRVERPKTVLDRDKEFEKSSKVQLTELTPVQIENLALLGKVWGFTKYHHPRVTAGELHWDFELFRVLPKVLAASSRDAGNAVMLAWLNGYGELKPCDPCAAPLKRDDPNLHLAPNLDWISDEKTLGAPLSGLLREIYTRRPHDGKQFYIGFQPFVGNANFEIEPGYFTVQFPDAGYQLLALYRFWNIIEYWFPYRDVIGEDWNKALAEMIPRVMLAGGRDPYLLEMIAAIARVHDTHANLWSGLHMRPPLGNCRAGGVTFRFLEGKQLVATRAAAGLALGDVVTHLNGTPVADLVARWAPYYAASNAPTRLRDMAREFDRGACDSEAKFTLVDKREVTVKRVPADQAVFGKMRTHDRPGKEAFERLSNDVAYLKMSAVKASDVPKYLDLATGTKGWIIDSRNYPSDFVPFVLGALFVDAPTPFARFTTPDGANPGAFRFGAPLQVKPAANRYKGKVIVLLDEISQSSSEYQSMALRAGLQVKVIGSTTAAADGNVSAFALPGGQQSMISGIGVFYPDKRPTQRVGIVPDIEVKPTVKGIREGRDELLDRAIEEILRTP